MLIGIAPKDSSLRPSSMLVLTSNGQAFDLTFDRSPLALAELRHWRIGAALNRPEPF